MKDKREDRGERYWRVSLKRAARETRGRIWFWGVALIVGIVSGYAAIGFRLAIEKLQTLVYGAGPDAIHTLAAGLNPFIVFIIPVCGGLAVGLILWRFTPDAKALSVSDVISAGTLRDARVNRKAGLASAAASLITLSTGGSTGREGPVVHLSAVIAGWVDDKINIHGVAARDILGCAVAAAVSASFNAPIAGALFALEVVLRHYALHSFGPIVLASVAGAVISRIHLGDFTEFSLPPSSLQFFEEIPAFMILGLVAGIVAVILMRALFFAEDMADALQKRAGTPVWLRPTVAGTILGLIAIWFPHIIGVGYETTTEALTGNLTLTGAILFAVVKGAAVCVTYAGRMGGGVFSPALMMGAFTGLAFGHIAVAVFPDVSGSEGLYALAGTGAVAAAVLGAPISTTLIVFELTGDYQAAIAVMISVSLATVLSHRFVWKSFFLSQLMRAGVRLAHGAGAYLPATIRVRDFMEMTDKPVPLPEGASSLGLDSSLTDALRRFDQEEALRLPVVDYSNPPLVVAEASHIAALKTFNKALIDSQREREG
ncbi:MAG: chloride channel protein [Paracoccaceae bacterium]|nr:chloride channel protein [Paracoccaceae bacterium]MDG1371463.1 chloride channel protein [Paracoccaceae bacterium]MDG1971655.1 chloride channel protein [Paracoccaceae bacterium]